MSNQRDYPEYEPWNTETYQTGSTQPPRNHGGTIAVLLVLVILLFGIITILGIANIWLSLKLNGATPEPSLPINFSNMQQSDPSFNPTSGAETKEQTPADNDSFIEMQQSPESLENIPQTGGLSLQEIYRQVIDTVVSISCSYPGGSSTGTGVILSEDGYIVTNAHVVENSTSIQVLLTDGQGLDASLVGMDTVSDLAVLHVTADHLKAAVLGDSSALQVGDTVVAIGDPLGMELRGSMTDGIVSAINRDIDVGGRTMNLIQTNAALNSGNSGGPLINCYGQVIGINTMKMGDTMSVAGVEGLGFAIPSTTVQEIVNQLIRQGYVSGRPSLGLTGEAVPVRYQIYYRLPSGLYITDVEQGGSAYMAGLQPGDILISLDDVAVTSSEILNSQLYQYEPGETVTAIVYRSGSRYSVTLKIGEATA